MEKKHISIMGSCVSRNLFNNYLAQEIFKVDKYAYHICPWDLFGEAMDISKEDLMKIYPEEFSARMVWYDVAKVTLKELERVKSEYLLLDFYTFVAASIEKITFNSQTCYSQNTNGRYYPFSLNKDYPVKLKVEKISRELVQDNISIGLKKFADWIKYNYDLNKVIIFVPSFASKYYDLENNIKDYQYSPASIIETTKKASLEFLELLDNKALLFDCSNFNCTGQFGVYDNPNKCSIPPNMHLIDADYIYQTLDLLKLLNIEIDNNISVSDLISFECVKFRNQYIIQKTTPPQIIKQFVQVSGASQDISLNEYFSKIENLNDFIIVISVMDEASIYYKNFNKDLLGLKSNLKFRDSYIAVVDKSRDFVYESISQNKIIYDYSLNGKTIHIESAGFNAKCNSVITINNGNNISKRHRGLNIVLLNSKTFEVIDSSYCDSFADKDLFVITNYFRNVKIKI